MKSENFLDRIGTYFSFSGEMIENCGEDACIYSFNRNMGLVGVFDGCGGLGSRRYQQMNSRTGAYIASRVICETTAKWFDSYAECPSKAAAGSLKAALDNALALFLKKTKSSNIKGSMTKDFPSTLAITVLKRNGSWCCCEYIWAGDSRGYYLSKSGLHQVTRDDIDDGIDALDNISNDGVLTNLVSAHNYNLHSRCVKVKDKGIVFDCTDGCFGYLRTPMEFEYVILYSLNESNSTNEWKHKLQSKIQHYSGDDHSISLAAVGFDNFNEMKKYYKNRLLFLYDHYIKKSMNADIATIRELWNDYKGGYYGGCEDV